MTTTIIGAGLEIEGEVLSDDEVVVQGALRGRLSSKGDVVIEQGALVEANVEGATFAIGGTVKGNVYAQGKVELSAEAKVVGDIQAKRIHIADGAHFKGTVDMTD